MTKKKIVAILSGGLDSTVALAYYEDKNSPYEIVHAVHFHYGQRHSRELLAAINVREYYSLPGLLINLDPRPFGKESALMDSAMTSPPRDRSFETMTKLDARPASTFVPGRNLIFIAQAAAFAYTIQADGVMGGWHWDDSSGYPDCREAFLAATHYAIQLALDWPDFQLLRPLIQRGKKEIIRLGQRYNAPLDLTWSCYNGEELACGHCDACLLRLKGFEEVGLVDPIPYQEEVANA